MKTYKNILSSEHLDILYNPKFICQRHDFTNWFCPYFDFDQEIMINTCIKCGKVKNRNIAYKGKDGKGRIIINTITKKRIFKGLQKGF